MKIEKLPGVGRVDDAVRSTCPYCGVGCGVIADREADGRLRISGDPNHPANFGRLCSKGAALADTFGADTRLLYPLVGSQRVDWDQALDHVAGNFRRAIDEHGPSSVAMYVSGQILTEDYYVANKLMKGYVGTANIDTNSRLCMASSVAGHRKAFGSDTVPGNYEDLEQTDLLVLVGSNLAWCHPVLFQRIAAARKRHPQMRIVLIDPRRTMTVDLADMHLPIRPDGDVALFVGLLNYLAETGVLNRDWNELHTDGLSDALEKASSYGIDAIAALTGLQRDQLQTFYSWFAETERTVTVYSQGVNQSSVGTDKVNAIINCHLATARIGRPGMGPFSVTGQPNAMGGREVGGLANMLAAHLNLEDPAHRELVQTFWRSPTMAQTPGYKAVDLFDALADGRIKALWIMATNPVDSLPQADVVRAAIKNCPFVVVSDVQTNTDTVELADVALPSMGWGEKSGTVTNSERRISRQRAFVDAPGDTRPDWWQIVQVARRLGYGDGFQFESAAEIFREFAAMSGFQPEVRRDFDISAFAECTTGEYNDLQPFQWPAPTGKSRSESRFFANGDFYTPNRRARVVPIEPVMIHRTTDDLPLVLNTGRIRDHWHTMTRTALSSRLSQHIAEPFIEVNPSDADRYGLLPATLAKVSNDLGWVVARVQVSERQRAGSVFIPMHWTDQFASCGRVGTLIPPRTDPFSGQPASKNVAVRVAPQSVSRFGFAISRHRPCTDGLDYWALAACQQGWRLEFAQFCGNTKTEPHGLGPVALAETIVCAPKTRAVSPLEIFDDRSGTHHVAIFNDGQLIGAVYSSAQPVAVSRNWAVSQLSVIHDSPIDRHRVLAGRAGADLPDPGAIVCACWSVGSNDILIAAGNGCRSVQTIGEVTRAGTNCGSCRAEIAALISEEKTLEVS